METKNNFLFSILGWVVGFFLTFLLILGIVEMKISSLKILKVCNEESLALFEAKQESFQKDLIVKALVEKVKDKERSIQILTKIIEEKSNCEKEYRK